MRDSFLPVTHRRENGSFRSRDILRTTATTRRAMKNPRDIASFRGKDAAASEKRSRAARFYSAIPRIVDTLDSAIDVQMNSSSPDERIFYFQMKFAIYKKAVFLLSKFSVIRYLDADNTKFLFI